MNIKLVESIPGTKHTHNGVEYIAAHIATANCNNCAFLKDARLACWETEECREHETIWLTQQNYIIHRLKS